MIFPKYFHCATPGMLYSRSVPVRRTMPSSRHFVQHKQAQERSLWRFPEKRPRPMGVAHNVTKSHDPWPWFFTAPRLIKKALCQSAMGLLLLAAITQASQTCVVSIPSAYMKKSFNAAVITPEEYKNNSSHFSVVYLLHGYSGDYLTWTRVAPLDEYADRYHVVFVCPDGNFNSWYMDSRFERIPSLNHISLMMWSLLSTKIIAHGRKPGVVQS